jgi:hypothetical protein
MRGVQAMSELDDIKRKNTEQLDQMSTDDLEELLKAKSQSSENTDMEDVFSILEVIEKREKTNPSGKYTGVDAAWDSFQKNYRPSSKEAKSIYDFAEDTKDNTSYPSDVKKLEDINLFRRDRRPLRRKALLRMACVIASVVIVLFSSTIVARAFGFDLWGAVAKWTSDTFGFESKDTTDEGTVTGPPVIKYVDLAEALYDYNIAAELVPSWIPNAFSLADLKILETPKKIVFDAVYNNDNKSITIHITDISEGTNGSYEKDEQYTTIYEKNDIIHYIMTNNEQIVAIWMNENYECMISGNLSEHELKKMIDSIYER